MSDAALFLPLPDDDTLYAALLARDPAYDGFAFVGVKSTGVFCRLTCPARKPKRENTLFFDSIKGCVEAGFRPCLRCRPLERLGTQGPLVSDLLQRLGRQPQRRWFEDDLAALGYDPSTVRRAFKREFGVTFLEMARLRRLGQVAERLSSGARVIDAQLDASFDSDSGFRSAFARLLGEPPSQLRGRELLKADWLQTPLGAMLAVADAQALHLLEFFDRPALSGELKRLQKNSGSSIGFGRFAPIDRIEAELAGYFDGTPVRFQTPLALNASAFTCTVWQALREVPCGSTQSYAGLARSIGSPLSVRAVARANGANQIAIVIPCHRVIGSDGSLTGYGGGLWRKRWLLEHERRMGAAG
ncbi:TPA: bifunctional transcriptional activator/DNA repair enzyme AdaA [Pseudomonas aeruginosa]|uniref:bifunctional transcriptional activator/DNA repair enzyme AdaA n=1 Tax=Pseudomonas aeruginosa TaxID=287 RepID=UPI00053F03AA|nr:trifunctional transcriptional activator/DNA repair protein Ada/methylated-DNA--[protein]-cysteine S-methyltransferase [Pseudomonas aeruginosa]AYW39379.1 bifunctional transcriptional activator/DNA repair protein Ada [Pseudomonas aeruginosa]EIU5246673.1 bifunctional transcriptional activator/DNA repair protein Ada [Pseudomonas aeruginosa]EKV3246134.1 bifunctional transcriptional activator/DNA repair protein Ada [Pseudomonas aeruginosa]KAB0789495.1 bifunctional transcriptional activator/DNA rep